MSSHDDLTPIPLNRRLDDRIRTLCENALSSELDDDELERTRQNLLCLMHEKMNRIRKLAARHFLEGESTHDRRAKP
jgi:hypothetical protein